MLCGLTEGGRPKCEQYWPKLGGTLEFLSGGKVQAQAEEGKGTPAVEWKLRYECEGTSGEVTQYHYTAWPDHGVPQGDSLGAFEGVLWKTIEHIKNFEEGNAPFIVHCSAGIGWTGTLITLAYIIEYLEREGGELNIMNKEFSVYEVIKDIWKSRFGLV